MFYQIWGLEIIMYVCFGAVGKAVHNSIGQCEFVGGVSKLQWGFEFIWEFTLSEFEFFRGCSPLNKYLMAHGT